MNYLDLFSGIGGFAYGAYLAGMKFDNHYFSEIDPYCIQLYQKRFPDAIALGDIRKIDISILPAGEWIITGGFPCQDISVAGKGEGIEGARSGLWFEMRRIIRELRPRFAIIENVGAIAFRGLDRVLSSLAEIGYDAEWQDIRASDMGAPHKRERIWIVAYDDRSLCLQSSDGLCPGRAAINSSSQNVPNPGSKKSERISDGSGEKVPEIRRICKDVPNSYSQHDDGTGYGAVKICGKRQSTAEIQRNISDSDSHKQNRMCGFMQMGRSGVQKAIKKDSFFQGVQWGIEPAVGRMANGIPHRVDRLRGLGNSIVPQIAAVLFTAIKTYLVEAER